MDHYPFYSFQIIEIVPYFRNETAKLTVHSNWMVQLLEQLSAPFMFSVQVLVHCNYLKKCHQKSRWYSYSDDREIEINNKSIILDAHFSDKRQKKIRIIHFIVQWTTERKMVKSGSLVKYCFHVIINVQWNTQTYTDLIMWRQ